MRATDLHAFASRLPMLSTELRPRQLPALIWLEDHGFVRATLVEERNVGTERSIYRWTLTRAGRVWFRAATRTQTREATP